MDSLQVTPVSQANCNQRAGVLYQYFVWRRYEIDDDYSQAVQAARDPVIVTD